LQTLGSQELPNSCLVKTTTYGHGDTLKYGVSLTTEQTKMPSSIRLACPSEREAIVSVINAVAGERRWLHTDHYQPTVLWEQLMTGSIQSRYSLLMVLTVGATIVGFARLLPGEQDAVGDVGIAILPAFRGRGWGTQLLGQLVERSSKMRYKTLTGTILADNLRSIALFRKLGFQVITSGMVNLPFRSSPIRELNVSKML
jgi:RimJ/RimL family protein N-acetyltransferase